MIYTERNFVLNIEYIAIFNIWWRYVDFNIPVVIHVINRLIFSFFHRIYNWKPAIIWGPLHFCLEFFQLFDQHMKSGYAKRMVINSVVYRNYSNK